MAATQFSPKAENEAVLKDAADQLGVEPGELSAALEQALENRVDAAVTTGRLTQEQGDALKARIEAGDVPLFGGPGLGRPHGPGMFRRLGAAASYLGLTDAELRTRLESGDTLAGVAKAEGKSADGLVAALVAAAKQDVADAVEAGRLTEAQQTEILAGLEERITALVNGEGPPGGLRGGPPPNENGGSGGTSGGADAYGAAA